MKQVVDIIWMKRDLRIQDHACLYEASKSINKVIWLYCFEPSLLQRNDSSDRHVQFVFGSILDIKKRISVPNNLHVFHADFLEVLKYLNSKFTVSRLLSYQESGPLETWKRDKKVKEFCKTNSIEWIEFQQNGIQRGITNRKGWDQSWYKTMFSPIQKIDLERINFIREEIPEKFNIPDDIKVQWKNYPNEFQPPGETFALKYLKSFVLSRGFNYSVHISKPSQSRLSCSRLSPYLAWGNISIKQAYQMVTYHDNFKLKKRSFKAFTSRLRWHCHFIQKFENQVSYEFKNLNPGFDSLKYTNEKARIEAWEKGQTGFPLVDACMRCLIATGWVNFRMRAMLVSFLCHHLDVHWSKGVYHMARLFLDYEPGIHFTQFQMQAGTTGINTVRIYNPVKQAEDHDPDGDFVKKWVPELRNVPKQFIVKPWEMDIFLKLEIDFEFERDYPNRIIDLDREAKRAREKIWSHRRSPQVKKYKPQILLKHARQTKRN